LDEFEFFLEKDWSDGFPVVTPTEDRVSGMLRAMRRDPDEVIGFTSPRRGDCDSAQRRRSCRDGGMQTGYFPVVLGGLAQILREELNMGGRAMHYARGGAAHDRERPLR